MKRLLRITFLILIVTSCNNLMDADRTERLTFIKTFNGVTDLDAAALEITNDAILILANMPDPEYSRTTRDSVITVLIKTDLNGNLIGKAYYKGGQGNAIKVLPDNSYLILGQTNPVAGGAPTKTRITHVNHVDLSETSSHYKGDVNISYKGVSLTLSGDKIIVLGSYKENDGLERPYVETFANAASLDAATWFQKFDLINRNYKNAKAVHYTGGSIIWASAIAQELDPTSDESYLSIPYVEENSVFTNYSMLGQNEGSRSFRPLDIQQAHHSSFGFGVVGTRANTNQANANMFFLRTDLVGNIIESSIKFYDALIDVAIPWEKVQPNDPDKNDSHVDDFGTALTATRDGGFVLAGHYKTGDSQKNDDILLIKIDVQGNIIWKKIIGGKGDEHVTAIRETEDRGLLICGTNIVENVQSIFLIKTDKNGELKN
jgi:hypothetical protein